MKRTIMVVDDTPDVCYTIKACLEELGGYKVIIAESGKKCIEKLKKVKPDLILLDIMMEDLNGWDVCAEIKNNKDTSDIPVIFLTAKTDSISVGFGKMGSEGYITKPFELDDLKAKIDKILKQ